MMLTTAAGEKVPSFNTAAKVQSSAIEAKERLFGLDCFLKQSSFVLKCGCHCDYTNENSDSGNQKATSECALSISLRAILNTTKSLSVVSCGFVRNLLGFCCFRRSLSWFFGFQNRSLCSPPSLTSKTSDESRTDCAIAACLTMSVLLCFTALFGNCATLFDSLYKSGQVDLA